MKTIEFTIFMSYIYRVHDAKEHTSNIKWIPRISMFKFPDVTDIFKSIRGKCNDCVYALQLSLWTLILH